MGLQIYKPCKQNQHLLRIKSLPNGNIVERQWLEQLGNHENMFETGVVRANEC